MNDQDTLSTTTAWLPEDELSYVRERVPTVYVEAIPVRTNHLGVVERVGLLLTARSDGTLGRAIVSGRVLYGETVREALWRNLSKDLGPDAEPLLPPSVAPFTVAEYFPDPESDRVQRRSPARRESGLHRPGQRRVRAVSGCAGVQLDDGGRGDLSAGGDRDVGGAGPPDLDGDGRGGLPALTRPLRAGSRG